MQGVADHYTVLGVAKNAAPEEIKKAHRRLVMTAHPDAGGDPETFRKIQQAYEILMDPERRERYDKGEPDPKDPAHAAFSYVAGMVNALIKTGDERLMTLDIVDMLGEMCDKDREKVEADLTGWRKKVALINKVRGRLKHKGEGRPDIITGALNQQEKSLNGQIAAGEYQLALLKLAAHVIADYTFDPDERPKPQFDGFKFAFSPNGFGFTQGDNQW